MSQLHVSPVPAFQDNYIWVMHRDDCQAAVVIDPGDGNVVIDFLQAQSLELVAMLITHHHADHIGGIKQLKRQYPDTVIYGPARESIPNIDYRLSDGDYLRLDELSIEFRVLDVPGHTAGHIAYIAVMDKAPLLFCGDTLFAVGCGRLFEGTAKQLHISLEKLSQLPADTQVYCTHEYTLNNIEFALTVDPDNIDLQARKKHVQQLRKKGLPSLPSSIEKERATNPFLRVAEAGIREIVQQYCGKQLPDKEQVFAEMRKWKDYF